MICNSCGEIIPDDAKFCQECGTPQKNNDGSSSCVESDDKEIIVEKNARKGTAFLHYPILIAVCISIAILFFSPYSISKYALFLIASAGLLYLCAEKAFRDIREQPHAPTRQTQTKQARKKKDNQETYEVHTKKELRDFCTVHPLIDQFSVKVKGVTYCNDDGTSRQEVLSCCYAGQQVGFRRYTFEGSPAFAVVTDYGEIGNLPRELAENLDYAYGPESYLSGTIGEIVGGYDGLYYGCVLDVSVYGPKRK